MYEDGLSDEEFRILCCGSKEKVYLKINRRLNAEALHDDQLDVNPTKLPFEEQQPRTRAGDISDKIAEVGSGSIPLNLDLALCSARDLERLHFIPMADVGAGFAEDVQSPLCLTVEMGISSAVESLISAGYDVNCKDVDGNSPLHIAVCCHFYDITKVLLRHGCVLDTYNKAGYTPLHVAVLHRDEHALAIICNYQRRHSVTPYSLPAGHHACPAIDLRALFSGETCLHIAVEQNCVEIVKILVEEGASVDAVNYFSQTPLVLACRYNYIDVASVLLRAGADSNVTGLFGNQRNTPLGLAAKYNYLDLAKTLVDQGADVNLRDDSAPCPLFTALLCESEDVATYLLMYCHDKGLNVALTKGNGETLLHALMAYTGEKRLQFARLLVERGCPVNQASRAKQFPLHEAVARVDHAMTTTLLQLGGDMRVFDRWGQNALHISIALGQLEIAKILLVSGANMDARTSSGRTALFIALDQGHFDLAEFLIMHGCDLSLESYLHSDAVSAPRRLHDSRRSTPFPLTSHTTLRTRLQEQASAPSSLFVITLRKIRKILSSNCVPLERAYEMPLPSFLQRFICFSVTK